MKVEFGSIVIMDFKAFKGRHGLALNGAGVIYIVGDNRVDPIAGNGASKSSLWDALCWCLYGQTPRGLGNPDVVPWSGGKPSVTVAFSIDGTEYLAQRTVGPNRFTVNGADIVSIEEVLPISLDLFINTILLPQKVALFLDKTPTKKMDLFTDTLGLNRWDHRSEIAKQEADKLGRELDKIALAAAEYESALDEVVKTLGDTQADSTKWHDSNLGKTQASKRTIEKLQAELEIVDKKLSTAILTEDSALTEKRAEEVRLRALNDQRYDLRGEITDQETKQRDLREKLEEAELRLAEVAKAKNCPVCGQPVKKADLSEHRSELADLIKQGEATLKARDKNINRTRVAFEEVEKKLDRSKEAVTNFTDKANNAQDDKIRYKEQQLELDSKLVHVRIDSEEVNPYLAQIKTLQERKKKIERDLREVEAFEKKTQQEFEEAQFWVKGFKEIKLKLIEDVLADLEFAANSMIEEVGLEGWLFRFDIEKESKSGNIQRKIDVQISSPESKGFVKWESWSGGEQQRLKLVGSLSLADVLLEHAGIETNLEILDEPAVYWSIEGVEELCAFLATRSRERDKTCFYIEHQAVESSHFNEVIKIVKDKEGAYIA